MSSNSGSSDRQNVSIDITNLNFSTIKITGINHVLINIVNMNNSIVEVISSRVDTNVINGNSSNVNYIIVRK